MISYPATNSIIITEPCPQHQKDGEPDRRPGCSCPEGKGKINVYYLRHANSEDFAKVMSALVSRLPAPPPGGQRSRRARQPSSKGRSRSASDKATNSLIIVASPGDFETIKDVIQKLDIRRRQVYVEVAIIEMSLSKQRELGFEFQAANLNKLSNGEMKPIGGTNFGNIGNVMTGRTRRPGAT